jgi:hypothetical protein
MKTEVELIREEFAAFERRNGAWANQVKSEAEELKALKERVLKLLTSAREVIGIEQAATIYGVKQDRMRDICEVDDDTGGLLCCKVSGKWVIYLDELLARIERRRPGRLPAAQAEVEKIRKAAKVPPAGLGTANFAHF